MNTPSLRPRLATTALLAGLGLTLAGSIAVAQAQGWGGGPGGGMRQGMGPGMGPGMSQDMGQGMGVPGRGFGGGPGACGGGRGGPMPAGPGNLVSMLDDDGDGTLTRAEFETFHQLAFRAMDGDGDGKVTRDGFIESRRPPMLAAGDDDTNARVRGRMGARMAERIDARAGRRFDVWDGDGDGVVAESEFMGATAARFAQFDLDQDNTLTEREMLAQRLFGPHGPMTGQ